MDRFDLNELNTILKNTPIALKQLLSDLPNHLIVSNEGGESWSPYDIVGHLIHGEKTDWIPRAKIILSDSNDKRFKPFDRFAQMESKPDRTIHELLDDFEQHRQQNLAELSSLNINEQTLSLTGIHPEFGEVSLRQLLSTWGVHDLGHIAQINRVIAKQYKTAVGPWGAYLPILR